MAAKRSTNKRNTKRRNKRRQQLPQTGFSRMRARTERINSGVRLGFCLVGLMLACAFAVTALPQYRKNQKAQQDLQEVQLQELDAIDRVDAKKRELRAVTHDKAYLGLIARDRLDYYIPGETIFRIER